MKAIREYVISVINFVVMFCVVIAVVVAGLLGLNAYGPLGLIAGVFIGLLGSGMVFGFWFIQVSSNEALKELVRLTKESQTIVANRVDNCQPEVYDFNIHE